MEEVALVRGAGAGGRANWSVLPSQHPVAGRACQGNSTLAEAAGKRRHCDVLASSEQPNVFHSQPDQGDTSASTEIRGRMVAPEHEAEIEARDDPAFDYPIKMSKSISLRLHPLLLRL